MKRAWLQTIVCSCALLSSAPAAGAPQTPAFVPPSGWTPIPASMVSRPKVVWTGPGSGAAMQTFNAMSAPFTGTVEMAANGARTAYARGTFGTMVGDVSSTVCGLPVRTFTTDVAAGPAPSTIVQELMVKDGNLYVFTYVRPKPLAADAPLASWMKDFCPSDTEQLSDVVPPTGWKASDAAKFVPRAMWMAPQAGSVVGLMSGPPTLKLADAAKNLTDFIGQQTESAKRAYQFAEPTSGTLCGNPALFVAMTMTVGNVSMRMNGALTQNGSQSYGAVYVHPADAPDDPAALSSLKTLCANGVMPAPAAPPSAQP